MQVPRQRHELRELANQQRDGWIGGCRAIDKRTTGAKLRKQEVHARGLLDRGVVARDAREDEVVARSTVARLRFWFCGWSLTKAPGAADLRFHTSLAR